MPVLFEDGNSSRETTPEHEEEEEEDEEEEEEEEGDVQEILKEVESEADGEPTEYFQAATENKDDGTVNDMLSPSMYEDEDDILRSWQV